MAIQTGPDDVGANKQRPATEVWVVAMDASETRVHGPAKLSQLNWNKPGWNFIAKLSLENVASSTAPQSIRLKEPPLLGLQSYLETPAFPGIGPETAKKLIAGASTEIFSHLSGSPQNLAKQCGISLEIAEKFSELWQKREKTRHLQILIRQLGFKNAAAREVVERFGNQIIEKLLDDPFLLVRDLRYFSFDDASRVSMLLGGDTSDTRRLHAAIEECLYRVERERGHTCAPKSRVVKDAAELTSIALSEVEEIFADLPDRFASFNVGDREFISTKVSYDREKDIFDDLTERSVPVASAKQGQKVRRVSTMGAPLSKEQLAGVQLAVDFGLALITGGPGTGKSTLVATLVRELKNRNRDVTLCAPTGRAAKRLQEAPDLKGVKPSTIHRMLSAKKSGAIKKIGTLIIDEASMIDLDLMGQVLSVLDKDDALIFIGDANQLPPVGPGQLFRDLLKTDAVKSLALTENFRQRADGGIVEAANKIVGGEPPGGRPTISDNGFAFFPEEDEAALQALVLDLYFKGIPSEIGIDPIADIQILSPQRTGLLGTLALNRKIQARLWPGKEPAFQDPKNDQKLPLFVGDKVINTSNNYEIGVMNGDIGTIVAERDGFLVEFDGVQKKYKEEYLDSLEPAYAVTVHKAQGSEYPSVILPVVKSHNHMLGRNLIYTGLTRGKRCVVAAGSIEAFNSGIGAAWKDFRYSVLPCFFEQPV